MQAFNLFPMWLVRVSVVACTQLVCGCKGGRGWRFGMVVMGSGVPVTFINCTRYSLPSTPLC